MAWRMALWLGILCILALLTALWPEIDVAAARLFYNPGQGFPAQDWGVTRGTHALVSGLPTILLGCGLAIGAVAARLRRRTPRPWLFLLLVLLIGPGLLANLLLKEHWGRARPLQTIAFGGTRPFTPWWLPAQSCASNCAFVSGDGSMGFVLPAVAFIIPRRRRAVFWGMVGFGSWIGLNRMMMGAHALSDTVIAALLMMATMIALHRALYGAPATRAALQDFG